MVPALFGKLIKQKTRPSIYPTFPVWTLFQDNGKVEKMFIEEKVNKYMRNDTIRKPLFYDTSMK